MASACGLCLRSVSRPGLGAPLYSLKFIDHFKTSHVFREEARAACTQTAGASHNVLGARCIGTQSRVSTGEEVEPGCRRGRARARARFNNVHAYVCGVRMYFPRRMPLLPAVHRRGWTGSILGASFSYSSPAYICASSTTRVLCVNSNEFTARNPWRSQPQPAGRSLGRHDPTAFVFSVFLTHRASAGSRADEVPRERRRERNVKIRRLLFDRLPRPWTTALTANPAAGWH